MHRTAASKSQLHDVATSEGALHVKVVDSIGESKAKLIEVSPDNLAALRAAHPSVRIVPVVYYQPAVHRYTVAGARSVSAKVALSAKSTVMTVTVISVAGGKPVVGATVVAFTDFANRVGAQGTTNAKGLVGLALGGTQSRSCNVSTYTRRLGSGLRCKWESR